GQHVTQLAEEAGAVLREPAFWALFAPQRGQLGQQPPLLVVQAPRRLDLDVDDEVAASGAAQVRDSEAAEGDGVTRLRPRLDLESLLAVQGRQAERGAEGRR